MSALSDLKDRIIAAIYQNTQQKVTGQKMQDALLDMIDTMGVSVLQNSLIIGSEYKGEISDVYDVTLHNSGLKFASMNALLSDANLQTFIPDTVKKAGMSIKFCRSCYNVTKNTNATEIPTGSINLDLGINAGEYTYEQMSAISGISGLPTIEGASKQYYVGSSSPYTVWTVTLIVDSKYEQWMFLSDSFSVFTNINLWQGIDNEPKLNSINLVESGGVYNNLRNLASGNYKALFTETNKYINSSGELVNNELFDSTGLIPYVKAGNIILKGFDTADAKGIAFYDGALNFLYGIAVNPDAIVSADDIPNEAAYIRFCTLKTTITDIGIFVSNILSLLSVFAFKTNAINLKTSNLLDLQYSDNLFIKDDATITGYLNIYGEVDSAYTGFKTTANYVSIKPNTNYKGGGENHSVCFYDADFNFLKQDYSLSSTPKTYTTPLLACYARFSTNGVSSFMFCEESAYPSAYKEGLYPYIKKTNGGVRVYSGDARFWGKKIATLGDSISFRFHYQQILDNMLGTKCTNFGISGNTIGEFIFHKDQYGVCDRLYNANDFADFDIIILCGYANSLNNTLGTFGDNYIEVTEEGASQASSVEAYMSQITNQSIYALAHSVIEYITRICPTKLILYAGALPMSRTYLKDETDFHQAYIGGATCRQISDAIKEVSEWYSIPYVDMERKGQVNINNCDTYYDTPDYVHPNFYPKGSNGEFPNSGMKRMAILLASSLSDNI